MSKLEERRRHIDLDAVLGGTPSSRTYPNLQRALRWLGLVVIIGLIAWFATSLGTSSSTTRYITEPAMRGSLLVTVTATGSVQPTTKVDISSELSGTVRKVNVDYNDAVTAGQVLAVLDTDKLKASADNSRAKLASAQAKVTEAQATVTEKEPEFSRKQALAEKHIASVQDLEASQAALAETAARHTRVTSSATFRIRPHRPQASSRTFDRKATRLGALLPTARHRARCLLTISPKADRCG